MIERNLEPRYLGPTFECDQYGLPRLSLHLELNNQCGSTIEENSYKVCHFIKETLC
jgi:hypothetical protein